MGEGKQDSAHIQYIDQNYQNWGNEYDYGFHVRFFENRDDFVQQLPYFASDSQVDWDAWERGEEIILVWYDFPEVQDQTVQAGETMEIAWVEPPQYLPVTVGSVYHENAESISQVFEDGYGYTMINVVASRQLAVRLAELYASSSESELILSGIGSVSKEKIAQANQVWGQFGENASFESTDKQLSQFAWEKNLTLETEAEARRVFYQSIVQEVSIFGSLFLLILAVFLILQKNLADSQNHYCSEQYRLFKKIGMEGKTYLRRTMISAIKDYVWIFGGAIVGYLLYGMFVFRQYAENLALDGATEMYCKLTENWTMDAKWLALDHVIYQIEHIWTLAIVVVVLALLMGNRFLQTRRYMKKGRNVG